MHGARFVGPLQLAGLSVAAGVVARAAQTLRVVDTSGARNDCLLNALYSQLFGRWATRDEGTKLRLAIALAILAEASMREVADHVLLVQLLHDCMTSDYLGHLAARYLAPLLGPEFTIGTPRCRAAWPTRMP